MQESLTGPTGATGSAQRMQRNPTESEVQTIKSFRKEIDALINRAEYLLGMDNKSDDSSAFFIRSKSGRELALVRTKLQEAKMWAGKVLETMGNPFPEELADKAK